MHSSPPPVAVLTCVLVVVGARVFVYCGGVGASAMLFVAYGLLNGEQLRSHEGQRLFWGSLNGCVPGLESTKHCS